jgi:FKBP-type peptidyl-prolyl cis-trans isomerase FkpA
VSTYDSGGAVPEEMKPFYALGVNIAQQVGSELKTLLSPSEIDVMLQGFADSMTDKVVDDSTLLMTYGKQLNEILEQRSMKDLAAEKQRGTDFQVKYLLSNVRAQKTSSGLIINEIIAGVGAKATAQSTCVVHYHGTLIDGTVFDSSVDRGSPAKFPIRNVIQGWQEGVAMMRVGGKATLVVPSDLAYGDKGSPPVIPAGATIIFEVELLEVV